MSDDVLSLVKAAQKERGQLSTRLDRLKKREVAIRGERKHVEERIAQIDEAFAPLKATLAGANVVAAKTVERVASAPREGSQMAKLVAALGGFGFREYTTREVMEVTELPMQNVYALLSQLVNAGRIKRLEPGKCRTTQAQIVGDGAA